MRVNKKELRDLILNNLPTTQWKSSISHKHNAITFIDDNFYITILDDGYMYIDRSETYNDPMEKLHTSFQFDSVQEAKEFLYEIDGNSFLLAEIGAMNGGF